WAIEDDGDGDGVPDYVPEEEAGALLDYMARHVADASIDYTGAHGERRRLPLAIPPATWRALALAAIAGCLLLLGVVLADSLRREPVVIAPAPSERVTPPAPAP